MPVISLTSSGRHIPVVTVQSVGVEGTCEEDSVIQFVRDLLASGATMRLADGDLLDLPVVTRLDPIRIGHLTVTVLKQ